MSLRFIYLSFFIGLSLFLNAQPFRFNIQEFGKQSGFESAGIINDIKSDKEGYLWIVSSSAIHRYNGNEFKRIKNSTTAHRTLLRFYETINGAKFVIDFDGLIYFIEADTLRAYEYNEQLKSLNERNRFVDVYFDKDNRLHISYMGSGYSIIDEGKISYPMEDKRVKIFGFACILREDNVPFMVLKYDNSADDEVSHYYLFDQDLKLIEKREIEKIVYRYHPSIAKMSNGNFLLSSGYGNILELSDAGFIKEIQYESGILSLLSDKHSGLWIGTPSGVNYYKNFITGDEDYVKINEGEFSVAATQDFEGGIWLYTGRRLDYISQPNQKIIKEEAGLLHSNDIQSLELVDDQIYVTSDGGKVSILDLNNLKLDSIMLDSLIIDEKYPALRFINDIRYDKSDNKIWMTRRGKIIYGINNKWKEISTEELIEPRPTTIYRFCDELYKTNYSLVAFYRNVFFLIEEDTISYVSQEYPKDIEDMLVVNDSIFVSTLEGLYLQIGDSVSYLGDQYPELKVPMYTLTYFQNKLWVSTDIKGSFVLENEGLKEVKFQDILINSARLIHPNSNELWLMSYQGSFLYNPTKNNAQSDSIKLKAYSSYRLRAPIKKGNTNSKTVYEGIRNQGIGFIEYDDIKKDSLFPPLLLIDQLKINRKERIYSDSIFDLAYDESFIQIWYIGISYRSSNISYRHRLMGLEQSWTETKEHYIQYTTLPSGEYTFEIQCRRPGQVWSESKLLRFVVNPPFWETWWFITITLLLIIFTVSRIVIYRFKIAQREKDLLVDRLKAQQSALRAQMDPHFVFNVLASVKYLITDESKEKAKHFLDLFSDSMRTILNQANMNYITVENEIKFLKEYIEMEQFRLEGKFTFDIQRIAIDKVLEHFIPPFMIQPFVENAIQHGLKNKEELGKLGLKFQVEGNLLKITIQDNGVGREKASFYEKQKLSKKKQKSHGLRIITERLELHNERKDNIQITDIKDDQGKAAGTVVTVYIRIMQNKQEINNVVY